jgi:solute carrier family 25 carnitine/acylcarnitine transporter 20/29
MPSFLQDLISGSISGFGNCISGYIFDTLKVRMQMDHSLTMMSALRNIIQNEGAMHLFSGMYYPMMTVPLINAIIFSAY